MHLGWVGVLVEMLYVRLVLARAEVAGIYIW
jgi:hypothetical protein